MYRKYWLLPFFLGIIGGVIGWLVLKDKDASLARKLLVFGLVWSVAIPLAIILGGYVLYLNGY